MNHLYGLSRVEAATSFLEQIEQDYIVPENEKPIMLKHLEEYFRLKKHGVPSQVPAKWAEISKIIDLLK